MGDGRRSVQESTYIRMSPDLLNNRVIKMARVAQEIPRDIVGMLEALKDIGRNRELRSLSKLGSLGLGVEVNVLHPAVMIRGSSLGDVFLEDNNVGVRHFNGIR